MPQNPPKGGFFIFISFPASCLGVVIFLTHPLQVRLVKEACFVSVVHGYPDSCFDYMVNHSGRPVPADTTQGITAKDPLTCCLPSARLIKMSVWIMLSSVVVPQPLILSLVVFRLVVVAISSDSCSFAAIGTDGTGHRRHYVTTSTKAVGSREALISGNPPAPNVSLLVLAPWNIATSKPSLL
jgi:hypothetical protein